VDYSEPVVFFFCMHGVDGHVTDVYGVFFFFSLVVGERKTGETLFGFCEDA
jgi:hypothetical protein